MTTLNHNFIGLDDMASIEGKLDKKGYPLNRASVTTHSGDSLIGIWRNGTRYRKPDMYCDCARF